MAAHAAALLEWACGDGLTTEQVEHIAKREPGRAWEANEEKLRELGRCLIVCTIRFSPLVSMFYMFFFTVFVL